MLSKLLATPVGFVIKPTLFPFTKSRWLSRKTSIPGFTFFCLEERTKSSLFVQEGVKVMIVEARMKMIAMDFGDLMMNFSFLISLIFLHSL
jgi:hypothetical protein